MRPSPSSLCSSDSGFEARYPEFSNIYRKLFQDARFDTALRRNREFEARKLRLVSVQQLKEHQHLRPERRADLIQSLLQGDFDRAQRLLSDDKKPATILRIIFPSLGTRLPSHSGAEPLKKKMKDFATQLSDSQFLFQLKGLDDKEVVPKIQNIEILAHSLLSSLIDETVDSMTHEMVVRQQDNCRSAIRDELRIEGMKLQNEVLVEFIRELNELNAQSAGRQDS